MRSFRNIVWILVFILALGIASPAQVGVNATLQSAAVANGNGVEFSIQGNSAVALTVNCNTCGGGTTVNFEGSEDGTNYSAVSATQVGTTATTGTSTTTSGITVWQMSGAGLVKIRARISAYSAGTITVTGHAIQNALGLRSAAAGGGPPSGAAGGDLGSTYPNPTVVGMDWAGRTCNFAASPVTASITTDTVLACDTSGGNIVVNLPASSNSGRVFFIYKFDSSANTVTINRNGSDTIEGSASVVLLTQWDSLQLVDKANALGTWAKVSPKIPGTAGNIIYNTNGNNFGAVTGSVIDVSAIGAGSNRAYMQLSQTWTSSDNTHSLHLLEPTATFNGSTLPNTFAADYATLVYKGSAGALHNGAFMGRTQDGGSGVTPVTNFDNFYADHFSNGTPTGPVTKYTFFNSAGGTVTGGVGNTYAWVCGFCFTDLGAAGSTALTLETGVDVQMPGVADSHTTTLIGVSIGGGRNGTGNYDALVVDTGESIFKQGIKQSLTLDSTLFAAPITQGGIPVGGIVAGFYQSNFPTAAQSAANINSLLTASNGITGSLYGNRQIVDNGGNGLVALLNPLYAQCKNSGAATTTECDGAVIDTPQNSGTYGTTRGLYVKSQAAPTQTNTPVAIETAGAADLVKLAGPTITNGGHGISLTSQTTITAGAVVKIDTANNSSAVLCAIADTTGCTGFAQNAATAGQTVFVLTTGNISTPLLGTGTCTKGQFVIADSTTAGRVKCTSTYAAGTVLGWATVAQAAVGSAVGVDIQIR